jgi:hypothetical protein
MPIASVTEVIEVIGYQLWRGVLWPYHAGHLGKYRSFIPENWIRRHIREAYQDDEPRLEISGIPVCQIDGISGGSVLHPTGTQGQIRAPFAGTRCSTPFLKPLRFEHGREAHSTECVEGALSANFAITEFSEVSEVRLEGYRKHPSPF